MRIPPGLSQCFSDFPSAPPFNNSVAPMETEEVYVEGPENSQVLQAIETPLNNSVAPIETEEVHVEGPENSQVFQTIEVPPPENGVITERAGPLELGLNEAIRGIQSFFRPSSETIYTASNGVNHRVANDGDLFPSAMCCWANAPYYKGVEVTKRYEVKYPNAIISSLSEGQFSCVCDVVFFQKTDLQVSMEDSPSSSPINFLKQMIYFPFKTSNFNLQKTQQAQQEMLIKIYDSLKVQRGPWGYCGFAILKEKKELRSLGLPRENAEKYHAVALFLASLEEENL